MKKILNSFGDFWLQPAPAERLAAVRIVIGLFSLGYLLPRVEMYREMARQASDLFEPIGVVAWMPAPLWPGVFDTLLVLTLLANVAFLLGWRFKQTGPAFGLLLLVLMCYRNSWSMIFHNDNVLVFHALLLGFAPAAAAYSIDARYKIPTTSWLWGQGAEWQNGWTIKMMMAVALTPYFLSGIAKIAGPAGLDWMTGEIMREQVATDTLRKILLGTSSSDAIFTLYDLPLLFAAFGILTMVVELGAPLMMASRKAIMIWAVLAYLMHWGILAIMDITFRYQLFGAMYACFFPIEYPARFLEKWFKNWFEAKPEMTKKLVES
jgi:hypothetical protein